MTTATTTAMIWHFNTLRTPTKKEIVELASKFSGVKAEFRDEIGGFQPHPNSLLDTHGSVWVEKTSDCSKFDFEYSRLDALITKPLNEPILEDDHPVYQGYLYVVNGSRVVQFIDGERMTVGRWKDLKIKDVAEVTEVRRCDIEGRKLRLPPKKEQVRPLVVASLRRGSTNKVSQNQKRRKPRNSNKIKKVST